MASSSTVKSLSRQKFEATFVVPFQRENVFDELVSYFRPLGVPTDGPGAVRFGVPDGAPYTPAEDSKFEMGWRRVALFEDGYVVNECVELVPGWMVKWRQVDSQKSGMQLVGEPEICMKLADTSEGATWCWIRMDSWGIFGEGGEKLRRTFKEMRQKAWTEDMTRRGYLPLEIQNYAYEPVFPPLTGVCYCGEVQVVALGEPQILAICHCHACRSWMGGIGQAVVLYPTDFVMITGELVTTTGLYRGGYQVKPAPGDFAKGYSNRKSCAQCYACVVNDHTDAADSVDLCGGLLDFGPGGFQPTIHLNYGSRIYNMVDGLPKFKDIPSSFGGSGEVIPEV